MDPGDYVIPKYFVHELTRSGNFGKLKIKRVSKTMEREDVRSWH